MNYIGVFFDERGNVICGDFCCGIVDYKGDEHVSCARFNGEKKTVNKFLKYAYNLLRQKGIDKNNNEKRLFNILQKKFL